jgi:FkbM family methyltransferase
VTEGKKALLRATRERIRPSESEQTVQTKHGFRLRLNLANPEQERIYFYGEHDERYETAALKRLVGAGMHCWDIGANIGYYTCLLARLAGPSGRVTAFEPAAATRARLEENVALNAFGNVRVLACAVGAAEGTARMHYSSAGLFEGTASLRADDRRAAGEDVAVRTLDSLVAELGAPQFLKIDVEGAQLDVWRGGRRFLSEHAPLVLAELRDSKDPAVLREIEGIVRAYGYRLHTMRKSGSLVEVERDALAPDGPRNFLLLKPAR